MHQVRVAVTRVPRGCHDCTQGAQDGMTPHIAARAPPFLSLLLRNDDTSPTLSMNSKSKRKSYYGTNRTQCNATCAICKTFIVTIFYVETFDTFSSQVWGWGGSYVVSSWLPRLGKCRQIAFSNQCPLPGPWVWRNTSQGKGGR